MNILIVDDSLFMRRMIRQIIERADHKVVGEAKRPGGHLALYGIDA